jgi:hypothetical protein
MDKMPGIISIAIEWSKIGVERCKHTFVVDARERKSLAGIFGLLELRKLVVEVEIKRGAAGKKIFNVGGSLQALAVQECVLCLGLISTDIRENFSGKFMPEAQSEVKEDVFIHTDPDHPEIYSGALLEIGKLVQDQLSLAIEPYPRHKQPGQVCQCGLKGHADNDPLGSARRPFAKLDNLLNIEKKNENS